MAPGIETLWVGRETSVSTRGGVVRKDGYKRGRVGHIGGALPPPGPPGRSQVAGPGGVKPTVRVSH
eukprot:755349-Hanusia_phi.AAC.1